MAWRIAASSSTTATVYCEGLATTSDDPRHARDVGCRSEPMIERGLPAAAYCTLRQLFHYAVQAEAAGLLTGRKLLERREELADDVLGGDADEGVVEPPVVVRVRRNVRPFVWVGPQIEELREPQRRERLAPDPQRSGGALFLEHELPVV